MWFTQQQKLIKIATVHGIKIHKFIVPKKRRVYNIAHTHTYAAGIRHVRIEIDGQANPVTQKNQLALKIIANYMHCLIIEVQLLHC